MNEDVEIIGSIGRSITHQHLIILKQCEKYYTHSPQARNGPCFDLKDHLSV